MRLERSKLVQLVSALNTSTSDETLMLGHLKKGSILSALRYKKCELLATREKLSTMMLKSTCTASRNLLLSATLKKKTMFSLSHDLTKKEEASSSRANSSNLRPRSMRSLMLLILKHVSPVYMYVRTFCTTDKLRGNDVIRVI